MSRKIVSILALLCFLAMTNYAMAYTDQFNWSYGADWHGTTSSDWFDASNWIQHVSPTGALPPDLTTFAAIEAKPPMPIINGNASTSRLMIHPWSWAGASDCSVDMNSGTFDCGDGIEVAIVGTYDSNTSGKGIFRVWNGTVTTGADGSEGLNIGSQYNLSYGKVIMYGGLVSVPRISLYYGDIALYGGTLEMTWPGTEATDSNFVFSQTRSQNKIDISGGTLKLKGNYTLIAPTLATLAANGRIYSSRGNLGVAAYDGTNTILTSYGSNLTRAWGPTPDNNATNINYRVADINIGVTLSWHAGDEPNVINHDVYFGTSASAVAAATPTSAEYMGEVNEANVLVNTNGDPNLFTVGDVTHPFAFKIATTYYWRVDENSITSQIYDGNGTVIGNNTSLVTGQVWNFTTQNGLAYNPKPSNGQVGLSEPLQVSWSPGELTRSDGITSAVSYHRVFFGTSSTQASGATATSTDGRYRGTVTNPAYALSKLRNVVSPATVAFPAILTPGTPLYWRVDEVNTAMGFDGSTPAKGKGTVWSFTPAAYITIDDFEDYNSSDDINANWKTGYNIPSCYSTTYEMAFDVTPTGTPSYVMDADGKHMSFYYDNVSFSEVNRPYAGGTVFTNNSVLSVQPTALRVDYLGAATNAVDEVYNRMYVAIEDTAGHIGVYDNTPDAQTTAVWTQWYLSLTDANFTTNAYPGSVNMAAVQSFRIGFGDRCLPGNDQGLGGSGNVMFDNIRLYASTCNPSATLSADLDGDCDIDINDLDTFANSWLLKAELRTFDTITAPSTPVLWYKFNDSGSTSAAIDSGTTGTYTGTVVNWTSLCWKTAIGRDASHLGCIYLPPGTQKSYVDAPVAALDFMSDSSHTTEDGGGISFSVWINADLTSNNMLTSWNGIFAVMDSSTTTESLEVECPAPLSPTSDPSGPRTDFVKRSPAASAVAFGMHVNDYGGKWNHWAFTKEPYSMKVYCNGNIVGRCDANGLTGDPNANEYGPLFNSVVGAFHVGTRGTNWGMWNGYIADFQVYNYTLSDAEVAYLATDGTGQILIPLVTKANLYLDGGTAGDQNQVVNFEDLSVMGSQWHQIKLWP